MNAAKVKTTRQFLIVAAFLVAFLQPATAGLPRKFKFTLESADGGAPVRLADFRGKVLLLEFSNTYCGSCRDLQPFFQELQKRYAQRGLMILAVYNGEDKKIVGHYIKTHPTTLKTVVDPNSEIANAFSMRGVPSVALFDGTNDLYWSARGFAPTTKDELIWRIEQILPGERGSVPVGQLK